MSDIQQSHWEIPLTVNEIDLTAYIDRYSVIKVEKNSTSEVSGGEGTGIIINGTGYFKQNEVVTNTTETTTLYLMNADVQKCYTFSKNLKVLEGHDIYIYGLGRNDSDNYYFIGIYNKTLCTYTELLDKEHFIVNTKIFDMEKIILSLKKKINIFYAAIFLGLPILNFIISIPKMGFLQSLIILFGIAIGVFFIFAFIYTFFNKTISIICLSRLQKKYQPIIDDYTLRINNFEKVQIMPFFTNM